MSKVRQFFKEFSCRNQHASNNQQDCGCLAQHHHGMHFQLLKLPAEVADTRFTIQKDTSPPLLKIVSVEELGNVMSATTYAKRDLGFCGKLGEHVLLIYGDTMFSDENNSSEFKGMRCNSAALATEDPTVIVDRITESNGYPSCFLAPAHCSEKVEEHESAYALGITNIIETVSGSGIFFYLRNDRSTGKDNIHGAGIGIVTLRQGKPPQPNLPRVEVKRKHIQFWDGDTDAWYGDVCALRANGYVYAYGHKKDSPFVFLCRSLISTATQLNTYEYWNGNHWQRYKLRPEQIGEEASVFWQINQGQVFWSVYHRCYVFIYCDNFWSCQVLARTAIAPEGPWSESVTVHKPAPIEKGGNVYAAIPHPYYDHTGRTLVITYTNHPNTIQAIRVNFA